MATLHTIGFLLVLGCCVGFANAECNATDDIPLLISSGWVCGKRRLAENSTYFASFQGIPYAQQPVGKRRFSALSPDVSWEGYLDASKEGPICPQDDVLYRDLVYRNKPMAEECILANIYVPVASSTADLSTQSGLPVIVFIHGGVFEAGSGDSDLFGPQFLVSKGVLLITFNYRLGAFGFLSLNSKEIPGNAGLKDCLTLLKWVQTNVAAFGGDPGNISLLGHSSGGTMAHLLSLSDVADGLFSRLMMSSGSAFPSYYTPSVTYAKYVSNLYLTELGINSTNTTHIHQTLTEMSLDKIMAASSVIQNQTGMSCFVPVIESEFENGTVVLGSDPVDLMKNGRGNNYPVMLGFNEKEMFAFEKRLEYLGMAELIEEDPTLALSPRLKFGLSDNESLVLAAEVLKKYFVKEPTLGEYYVLGSETYFISPQTYAAELRAKTGAINNTYLYYNTYRSENRFVQQAFDYSNTTIGPVHIEDMTLIFRSNKGLGDHISFPPTTNDDRMRDWMTDFFVNFTRCGDPTCSGGTLWQPVTTSINYQLIAKPYEYNNTLPTQEQRDMIDFFNHLDEEYVKAQSASSS